MRDKIYEAYKSSAKQEKHIKESADYFKDPWKFRDSVRDQLKTLADQVDSISLSETDFMYSDGDVSKAKRQILAIKAVENSLKKVADKVKAAKKA